MDRRPNREKSEAKIVRFRSHIDKIKQSNNPTMISQLRCAQRSRTNEGETQFFLFAAANVSAAEVEHLLRKEKVRA